MKQISLFATPRRGGGFVVLVLLALLLPSVGVAPAEAEGPGPGRHDTSESVHGNGNPEAVPAALAGHRHQQVCSQPSGNRAACQAVIDLDVRGNPATAGSAPAGYGPADLQSAYAVPSATEGAGRTVAVVAAYDAPSAENDLAVYRSTYGLPPCHAGCFTKVDQRGGSNLPSVNAGWAEEISLDLAMVSAICPNCSVLLVEADSTLMTDLGAAVNTAVNRGAVAVSNSYGVSEPSTAANYDETYFKHPGVAITASSGDTGYGVLYPASSPFVTAVGGTTLTKDSSGWVEKAWVGSGSGCSRYSSKPVWQHDSGCATRTVADVSAVADAATGVAVYNTTPGSATIGWGVFGGTSVSAPIIAAIYALAGVPPTGSSPASLPYGSRTGLYDVTQGNNGNCSSAQAYFCTAGTGYDGPTGLGSPRGLAAFSSTPRATRLNDFNGDAKNDLIARDSTGWLWLYPGTGGGGWLTRKSLGAGWNTMTSIVSAGDFNGDGTADVIARDSSGYLWLYPGTVSGGWSTRISLGGGWNVMSSIVAPGDFNGDGRMDLVARDISGELWLYPNNGKNDWLTRVDLGPGWNTMTAIIAPGDFDGDGRPDLIARDSSGQLWFYPGNGSNDWSPRRSLGAGWNTLTMMTAPGDMNGDSRPDIIARDSTGELWLYPNNGQGDWFTRVDLGAGWNSMTAAS